MQTKIENLCIFCGSNTGNNIVYRQEAEQLALALVTAEITLIFGGGKVGLMGVLADVMLKNGGKAIGVMPQSLIDAEIAHQGLTDLHIVNTMSERKVLLEKLSDGFVMLPGGPGSLDEFFEMYTQAYLGFHNKPCGVLNINNYYHNLFKFLDYSVNEGFLNLSYRNMIIVDDNPQTLLGKFSNYRPPLKKWEKTPFRKSVNAKS